MAFIYFFKIFMSIEQMDGIFREIFQLLENSQLNIFKKSNLLIL